MILTLEQLDAIAGKAVDRTNGESLTFAVTTHPAGLDRPHRLAHFLAQIMHESGNLRWVQEIWGPTAAQLRYEGRADLGNVTPGDGFRFRGRGLIQTTGRANYRAFTHWLQATDHDAPDFEASPDRLAEPPWSGLCAIWFWDTRELNRYADANNAEMITRRINGGLNGYADRLKRYTRAGLVLLGMKATDVRAFQAAHGLVVDGIAGPATRAALHGALEALSDPPDTRTTTERLAALEGRVDALEGRGPSLSPIPVTFAGKWNP